MPVIQLYVDNETHIQFLLKDTAKIRKCLIEHLKEEVLPNEPNSKRTNPETGQVL